MPAVRVAVHLPAYDRRVPDSVSENAADLAADADRLLAELDRDVPGAAGLRGECRPSLDVLETAKSIEVVVDLAGVQAHAVKVAIRRGAVVIVGAKMPPAADAPMRFHLAERSYGRFARVVRVGGAVDTSRATAGIRAGQLRISLPRITDRRGQLVNVPVDGRG
jgi:HSP20 family protein